jgi:hypothetical protein
VDIRPRLATGQGAVGIITLLALAQDVMEVPVIGTKEAARRGV